MAIVRSNAFPGTVFNPRLPRRSSTSPNMRGIVADPWLVQYPNGEPLSRALGEFIAAPDLQSYPNGQPLSNPGGGPVLVHKASLVKSSLKRVLRKRHYGMGDASGDGAGIDPSGGGSGAGGGIDPGTPGYDPSSDIYVQPTSDRNYNAINVPPSPTGPPTPISTIAGGYPTSSPTSALTNLVNSLFGRATAPGYGASGFAANVGAGLNTPIYQGSSITNGGVLLAGGLFLFLFMVMTGKKR